MVVTIMDIQNPGAVNQRESQVIDWLHRLTGVGMFLFLALHIGHIGLMGWGPEPFNRVTSFFNQPVFRVFHIFLFFSVLFHALNGLRIISLDFIPQLERYRRHSIYITVALFTLIFVPSTLLILMDAFLPRP